ncbi:MAG: hypothetical protein V1725_08190 [archaeon]
MIYATFVPLRDALIVFQDKKSVASRVSAGTICTYLSVTAIRTEHV